MEIQITCCSCNKAMNNMGGSSKDMIFRCPTCQTAVVIHLAENQPTADQEESTYWSPS